MNMEEDSSSDEVDQYDDDFNEKSEEEDDQDGRSTYAFDYPSSADGNKFLQPRFCYQPMPFTIGMFP